MWTNQKMRTLRRVARDGGSYADAAKRIGKSRAAISGMAVRNGIKFKSRKTAPVGSGRPFAKLKESDIPTIRRKLADGMTHKKIARQHRVSDHVIWRIANGKGWRGVASLR